jgi:hypothetical protein
MVPPADRAGMVVDTLNRAGISSLGMGLLRVVDSAFFYSGSVGAARRGDMDDRRWAMGGCGAGGE